MGLDKIKYHFVESPLTDHNLISLSIIIDKTLQSNSKTLFPNFAKVDFKNINKYLSEINWNSILMNQKIYNNFITNLLI